MRIDIGKTFVSDAAANTVGGASPVLAASAGDEVAGAADDVADACPVELVELLDPHAPVSAASPMAAANAACRLTRILISSTDLSLTRDRIRASY